MAGPMRTVCCPHRPKAELITVGRPQRAQIAFLPHWRARMLSRRRPGPQRSAKSTWTRQGRAVQGLYALLGLPFHPALPPLAPAAAGCPRKSAAMRPRSGKAHCPTSRSSSSTGWCAAMASGLKCCSGAWSKPTALAAIGYVIIQDITAQREAEQRIQSWPNHDEVTARTQLLDRIDAAARRRVRFRGFCCFHPGRSGTSLGRPWAMARAMPWLRPWRHALHAGRAQRRGAPWTAVNLQFAGTRKQRARPQGYRHARAGGEAMSSPMPGRGRNCSWRARGCGARFPVDAQTASELALEAAQNGNARAFGHRASRSPSSPLKPGPQRCANWLSSRACGVPRAR